MYTNLMLLDIVVMLVNGVGGTHDEGLFEMIENPLLYCLDELRVNEW